MEKLQRRSDGFFETPSGLFAIAPRARSGRKDGVAWFEFKTSFVSEVIRLEWPENAPVIAIDPDVARVMLRNNYANNITDELMQAYNAAVDGMAGTAPPAPETPPVPAAPDASIPAAPEPPPAPAAKGKGK